MKDWKSIMSPIKVGFIILFFVGCQSGPSFSNGDIDKAYQLVLKDRSEASRKAFVKLIDDQLASLSNKEQRIQLLKEAIEGCRKLGLSKSEESYVFTLLNEDYYNKLTPSVLLNYADNMRTQGKILPAEIVYTGILENFPSTSEATACKKHIIKNKAELYQILIDQSHMVVSKEGTIDAFKAKDFIHFAECWSVAMPKDTASVSFLFKAAEMARMTNAFPKALSLYTTISHNYPDHPQAPIALFIKGFILESQLKDVVQAKNIFKQFIGQYPGHALAKDAEFLLQHAGQDDATLLEEATKQ